MRFFISAIVASCLVSSPVFAAGASSYSLEGALVGSYNEANCRVSFSKYGKVWQLTLTPSGAYSPGANLFFSPKFGEARPGRYPIQFSFRGATATLGASVTSDNDLYSRDTDGSVTFEAFDDRIVGTFSFDAKSGEGEAVKASGQFDCPRGEALR